jgi:hypothetical protein
MRRFIKEISNSCILILVVKFASSMNGGAW